METRGRCELGARMLPDVSGCLWSPLSLSPLPNPCLLVKVIKFAKSSHPHLLPKTHEHLEGLSFYLATGGLLFHSLRWAPISLTVFFSFVFRNGPMQSD